MSIKSIYFHLLLILTIIIINNSLVSESSYHHRNSSGRVEYEFKEVKSGEFPWLVRIFDIKSAEHYCLGIILDRENILTSKLCVCGSRTSKIPIYNLRMVAGNNWLPTNGTGDNNVYQIQGIFRDAWSVDRKYAEEFAIIKTRKKIIFNDEVDAIRQFSLLSVIFPIKDGELLTSIQWLPFEKVINDKKTLKANSMIEVNVPVISRKTCSQQPDTDCLNDYLFCIKKEYDDYFLDRKTKFVTSLLIERDRDEVNLVGTYTYQMNSEQDCKSDEAVVMKMHFDFQFFNRIYHNMKRPHNSYCDNYKYDDPKPYWR